MDLIWLAFVVDGRRGQHNWRTLYHGIPKLFHIVLLPILKICLSRLEWLKILKDSLEEDSSIVAPEISHILFTYSDFIFVSLPILKVS